MSTNHLKWLGHSGFQLTTSTGRILLIDPWLSSNPLAPIQIAELPKAEFMLLTHDHRDHAEDAVAVTVHTGATLIGQPETVTAYKAQGVPSVLPMNIGGSIALDGIVVTMTDAYHTSATGAPAGYILTLEDGKVLYHAGDTCLHANMATWGDLYDIDLALLPIGGRFTMDERQAALSLGLLKPKAVSPMHYRTFPLLSQSADEFVRLAAEKAPTVTVHLPDPGDEIVF